MSFGQKSPAGIEPALHSYQECGLPLQHGDIKVGEVGVEPTTLRRDQIYSLVGPTDIPYLSPKKRVERGERREQTFRSACELRAPRIKSLFTFQRTNLSMGHLGTDPSHPRLQRGVTPAHPRPVFYINPYFRAHLRTALSETSNISPSRVQEIFWSSNSVSSSFEGLCLLC